MGTDHTPSIFMIALDTADPRLIERWTGDGSLPHLRRLRERGAYGRLASSADWLVGSPWPTFYTGTTPADHGRYHFLSWRSDQMALVRPDPDWLPLEPFWRHVAAAGHRTVAFDIPFTYPPHEPLNGVELTGWATHDIMGPPASSPPELTRWVQRQFGAPPLGEEIHRALSAAQARALQNQLVRATERTADVAEALLEREPWRLFLAGFGTLHRGGHKVWRLPGDEEGEEPSEELHAIYRACDEAVGRLIERTGGDTVVLVFSVHGMGPNTCRAEILPAMLGRVLRGGPPPEDAPERAGLLTRVRNLVPAGFRDWVKRRLPRRLQDRLTAFWRMPGTDWSRTRAFSLVSDLQGYVRINLRGREAAGIVEPGEEYDRLCRELAEGLATFTDADTGEGVVEAVSRIDALYPDGPRRSDLPDLVVKWSPAPAANHREITAPRYGSIPWPTPGATPDGRSGNHRGQGFLIAAGQGIQGGAAIEGAHILDLAPTVCALLNVTPTPAMRGKPLPAIRPSRPAAPDAPTTRSSSRRTI
jgi:predicted AlkP superfamily phosphohydrolase/phosphomutase